MRARQAVMAVAVAGVFSLLAGCQRGAPISEAVAQQPSPPAPPASPASATPSFPSASGPASSPPSSPIR
ncbi:MAG: hypothetical protein EOP39_00625 [Rubrivivax sp.]|nr:MAG: hypothetical protein EOP39_00625 [Rubrivivax sp.]